MALSNDCWAFNKLMPKKRKHIMTLIRMYIHVLLVCQISNKYFNNHKWWHILRNRWGGQTTISKIAQTIKVFETLKVSTTLSPKSRTSRRMVRQPARNPGRLVAWCDSLSEKSGSSSHHAKPSSKTRAARRTVR